MRTRAPSPAVVTAVRTPADQAGGQGRCEQIGQQRLGQRLEDQHHQAGEARPRATGCDRLPSASAPVQGGCAVTAISSRRLTAVTASVPCRWTSVRAAPTRNSWRVPRGRRAGPPAVSSTSPAACSDAVTGPAPRTRFSPIRQPRACRSGAMVRWRTSYGPCRTCSRRPTRSFGSATTRPRGSGPTGFESLDTYLSGGLRSGELTLLGGPQGLGKTTFALQILRHAAASGESVIYFSYEHDASTVLERLIAIEAASLAGIEAVSLRRIRESLEAADGREGGAGGPPAQHRRRQ